MEKDELYQKEWKKYAESLETWLKDDAKCPCCGGTKKCQRDCTFTEDDPDDAMRMINIREILALRPKK